MVPRWPAASAGVVVTFRLWLRRAKPKEADVVYTKHKMTLTNVMQLTVECLSPLNQRLDVTPFALRYATWTRKGPWLDAPRGRLLRGFPSGKL